MREKWSWADSGQGWLFATEIGDVAAMVTKVDDGPSWEWQTYDMDGERLALEGPSRGECEGRFAAMDAAERTAKVAWYERGWADPR